MTIDFRIEPSGESGGHCECCGNETRTVWGYVYSGNASIAAYFLHWTRKQPDHFPHLDFLIGTWGGGTLHDKRLVAWRFNPADNSFMVIDGAARPAANSTLCDLALSREQVINDKDLMKIATELIDAVWLHDPRVAEVRALANEF